MFKDLKKSSLVYVLDTSNKPRYYTAIVQSASAPYIPPVVPGQFNAMQQRVIDVVATIEGSNEQYKQLPENSEIASLGTIIVSCTPERLVREVETIHRNSTEILNNIDKHKENVSACEEILKEISPAFAQSAAQDERIKGLESKLTGIEGKLSDLDEIKSLLKQSLKTKN